jgi:toxin ParE1/3/4
MFPSRAEADLFEILDDFINTRPAAGEASITRIEAMCALLAESPLMGRDRSDLAPNHRSFPVGSHVIFYVLTDYGVDIVRVLHRRRTIPRVLSAAWRIGRRREGEQR